MTESEKSKSTLASSQSALSGAGRRLSIDDVANVLREGVPVRDEWRNALLHELSETPRLDRTLSADVLPDVPDRAAYWRIPRWRRTFAIQPLAAIAACLVAMIAGAAGASAFINRTAATPEKTVAAADATVPLINAANNRAGSEGRQIIRFAFVAPTASNVSLVGDFNNWDPKATPLKTTRDGSTWLIDMPLTAGRHVYAFVVDGDIVADPSAARATDHDFGVQNSVVLVGSLQ